MSFLGRYVNSCCSTPALQGRRHYYCYYIGALLWALMDEQELTRWEEGMKEMEFLEEWSVHKGRRPVGRSKV